MLPSLLNQILIITSVRNWLINKFDENVYQNVHEKIHFYFFSFLPRIFSKWIILNAQK